MPAAPKTARSWRVALADLGIVLGGFLLTALAAELLRLYAAGPIAITAGVLLASWRLALNAESWSSIGLSLPSRWSSVAAGVVVLYVTVVLGVVGIVTPIANAMGWPALDVSAYEGLRGNGWGLAKILLLVWTAVAFGEELLFRGFMMVRLEKLFGAGAIGTASAVALQAALFGVAHAYLGARGVMTATLVGVVYGTWYMLRGRNLWPLIIAHGLTDTISMVAIYAGVVPR